VLSRSAADAPAGGASDYAANFGEADGALRANGVFMYPRHPRVLNASDGRVYDPATTPSPLNDPKNYPAGSRIHEIVGVSIHQIVDGTSNTLMIGEKSYQVFPPESGTGEDFTIYGGGRVGGYRRCAGFRDWRNAPQNTYPQPLVRDGMSQAEIRTMYQTRYGLSNANRDLIEGRKLFGSAHPAGVPFAFGDGSVRTLQHGIDDFVLTFLSIRDDGQVIPPY
jgi:hypothetical protein